MPTGEKFELYKAILTMFQDEKVADAIQLVSGMAQEIDSLLFAEMKDRKLDSLKTNWFEPK